MKKLILLFLSLFTFSNAQTVFTETFDSLNLNIDGDTQALWQFYKSSANVALDLTANDNDLTDGDATETYVYASPFNNGDSIVFFSLGDKFSIATGSMTGINPGSNSFTWDMWFRAPDTNSTAALLITGTGVSQYYIYIVASDEVGVKYNNNYPEIPSPVKVRTNTWHYIKLCFDQTNNRGHVIINGNKASNAIVPGTMTGDLYIGATSANGSPFKGSIAQLRYRDVIDSSTYVPYLADGWTAVNYNVSRDLNSNPFAQTAWSDTLIVSLPDATLGNNQEWVLTSSNVDDVTVWIGSRASAKSVKKTITGGVSFASNTTYFGDGFSLVGDSLVVVFPADTASIDNIVLKKAQHHLKSPANRGWLGW